MILFLFQKAPQNSLSLSAWLISQGVRGGLSRPSWLTQQSDDAWAGTNAMDDGLRPGIRLYLTG